MKRTRRFAVLVALTFTAQVPIGCVTPETPDNAAPPPVARDESPEARARAILASAPLVDTHNDLPWVIREKAAGDVEGYDISVGAPYDTDIPRLRQGGVGTQFWSVYVPSPLEPFDAMRAQLEQIDIARRRAPFVPTTISACVT